MTHRTRNPRRNGVRSKTISYRAAGPYCPAKRKGVRTMPFGLQPTHLILILVVALLVFGPSRLPEIGRSFGSMLREFQTGDEGSHAEPAARDHGTSREERGTGNGRLQELRQGDSTRREILSRVRRESNRRAPCATRSLNAIRGGRALCATRSLNAFRGGRGLCATRRTRTALSVIAIAGTPLWVSDNRKGLGRHAPTPSSAPCTSRKRCQAGISFPFPRAMLHFESTGTARIALANR